MDEEVESFGPTLSNGIAESYGRFIFSVLKVLHTDTKWLHQFSIPSTVNEGSFFPASPPAFVVACLVDFCRFN